MKLAVMSDIHSNHHALEACIAKAEAESVNGFIFLGDYISDCAYPHKTMELLYNLKKEIPCHFVRGNREEYVLNYHKNGGDWRYGSSTGSLLYTHDNLTEADYEFFDSLPITDVINPNGKCDIRICHGSPVKSRDPLYPNAPRVINWIYDLDEKVILGGHIHLPFVERICDSFFMNPGTVGVPVSGDTKSQMAIIESDGNTWHPELLRVEYDTSATVCEMKEAGLLDIAGVWSLAVKKSILTGYNYPLFCVMLAERLAKGGEVTEEHWLEAAKQLQIE